MIQKHTTTVLLGELKALSIFTSLDPSRLILNGVCCEISKTKTILAASDGKRLAAIRTLAQNDKESEPVSFVIPTALICRMLGSKRRAKPGENDVVITYREPEITMTHGWRGYAVTGRAIEGSYPAWRRAVPSPPKSSTLPGPWSADACLLGDMVRVGRAMGLREPHVVSFRQAEPLSPIEVRFAEADNFYGVIMPIKTPKPIEQFDWLK